MDEKVLKISDETIKNISLEDLADLKVEIDELVSDLQDLINECNESINS